MTLLPDLLHLVKDFLLDDRRMGVGENRLFIKGRFSLLVTLGVFRYTLDFHFELRLFLLISPAHHRKPFIRNASCHIVLVDTDKQPIKFRQPLLCLCQTLPVSADGFLTGRPELLFRDLPEVLFIPCHIEDDRFHVHTDQLIQHNRSDEVCRTASRAAAVETYSKLCDWCCLRQQIASIAKSAGIAA